MEGSEIFQQVILRMPLGEPSAGHLCFTKETTSQGSQEQRSRILITHAGLGNNHLGSQCLPQGGWSSEFEQDLKQFWLTRLQLSGYWPSFLRARQMHLFPTTSHSSHHNRSSARGFGSLAAVGCVAPSVGSGIGVSPQVPCPPVSLRRPVVFLSSFWRDIAC